ncbi:hypothetical protein OROGR_025059 [Orobanche gracilis]
MELKPSTTLWAMRLRLIRSFDVPAYNNKNEVASFEFIFQDNEMRGGTGKSMPLVRELLDSGPRHTGARGVDASIRRQRKAARRDHVPCSDFGTKDSSGYYSHDEDDDQDIYEGGDDDSSFDLCRDRKRRAALAFMYRQLGIASRGDSMGICGCLTLVQAWIYEYFPCFRPHRERMIVESTYPRASTWSVPIEGKDEDRFQSLRRRIDQLTAAEIQWLPHGPDPVRDVLMTTFIGWLRYRDIIEPYMPGRALRQLGYVQTIPFPITRPEKVVRAWTSRLYRVEYPIQMSSDAWMMFPGAYRLPLADYQVATDDQTACADDYIEWYYRHSHPQLLNDGASDVSVIPSRSSSDYWVSRLTGITQHCIRALPPDQAAEATTMLEEYMRDWHLAN